MNGLILFMAGVGLQYGWQQSPDTTNGISYTYIVQLDDAAIDAIKNGQPLTSYIPQDLRRNQIDRIQIVYGEKKLPRPQVIVRKPPAPVIPASTNQPIQGGFRPNTADAQPTLPNDRREAQKSIPAFNPLSTRTQQQQPRQQADPAARVAQTGSTRNSILKNQNSSVTTTPINEPNPQQRQDLGAFNSTAIPGSAAARRQIQNQTRANGIQTGFSNTNQINESNLLPRQQAGSITRKDSQPQQATIQQSPMQQLSSQQQLTRQTNNGTQRYTPPAQVNYGSTRAISTDNDPTHILPKLERDAAAQALQQQAQMQSVGFSQTQQPSQPALTRAQLGYQNQQAQPLQQQQARQGQQQYAQPANNIIPQNQQPAYGQIPAYTGIQNPYAYAGYTTQVPIPVQTTGVNQSATEHTRYLEREVEELKRERIELDKKLYELTKVSSTQPAQQTALQQAALQQVALQQAALQNQTGNQHKSVGESFPEDGSRTWTIVSLLLFMSAGLNFYLSWIALSFYNRYRNLSVDARDSYASRYESPRYESS